MTYGDANEAERLKTIAVEGYIDYTVVSAWFDELYERVIKWANDDFKKRDPSPMITLGRGHSAKVMGGLRGVWPRDTIVSYTFLLSETGCDAAVI